MFMSLVSLLLAAGQSGPAVEDVRWLAGCWEMRTGARTITEYWLPPRGGTMIGVSRTVADGKTLEYEFIVLRAGANGLEYVAKPSGQPEAVFTSTSIRPGEVTFASPGHDFPTSITYRQTPEGVLATISGTVKGKPRAIDFKYTAADCSK